ncbi:MAG: hypothetical protein ACYTFA_18865, partial [Planctomycetota bacterium]
MSQFSVPWAPKREVSYGAVARLVAGVAKSVYDLAGPIVSRFSGLIMIGAVVACCLIVWVHALLFSYVDVQILGQASTLNIEQEPLSYTAPSTWGLPPSSIKALVEAGRGPAAS